MITPSVENVATPERFGRAPGEPSDASLSPIEAAFAEAM
jgi:hypothetical protein